MKYNTMPRDMIPDGNQPKPIYISILSSYKIPVIIKTIPNTMQITGRDKINRLGDLTIVSSLLKIIIKIL